MSFYSLVLPLIPLFLLHTALAQMNWFSPPQNNMGSASAVNPMKDGAIPSWDELPNGPPPPPPPAPKPRGPDLKALGIDDAGYPTWDEMPNTPNGASGGLPQPPPRPPPRPRPTQAPNTVLPGEDDDNDQ